MKGWSPIPSWKRSEFSDPVKISFYATLRPIVGARSIEVDLAETSSVQDLVNLLSDRWPDLNEHLFDEDGALSRRVNIMLDGRNIRWLEGLATPVRSAQKVEIFPPVAGG